MIMGIKELMMEISVVELMRLIWGAMILPLIIVTLPLPKLDFLYNIILVSSGRGKTVQSSSPLRKLTIPQKYFSHFYVLAVAWTSFLLLTTWVYAHRMGTLVSESTSHSSIASFLTGGSHIFSIQKDYATSEEHNYRVWRSVFLLLLMEIQVLRRLYESIYVFQYGSTSRMHVIGYLTGLVFYIATPLSLCCNFAPEVFSYATYQVTEFIVKGKDRMHVEFHWLEYLVPLLKLGWCQWIGAFIFFWGWFHQLRCHTILGNLREGKEKEDAYMIPYGDWFEIVSSPHYLAEIVIYGGIVVASGGLDLTIWLAFIFVVANLAFAAAETHRWYHRKFENYPSNRYAIIPSVY